MENNKTNKIAIITLENSFTEMMASLMLRISRQDENYKLFAISRKDFNYFVSGNMLYTSSLEYDMYIFVGMGYYLNSDMDLLRECKKKFGARITICDTIFTSYITDMEGVCKPYVQDKDEKLYEDKAAMNLFDYLEKRELFSSLPNSAIEKIRYLCNLTSKKVDLENHVDISFDLFDSFDIARFLVDQSELTSLLMEYCTTVMADVMLEQKLSEAIKEDFAKVVDVANNIVDQLAIPVECKGIGLTYVAPLLSPYSMTLMQHAFLEVLEQRPEISGIVAVHPNIVMILSSKGNTLDYCDKLNVYKNSPSITRKYCCYISQTVLDRGKYQDILANSEIADMFCLVKEVIKALNA